LFEMKSTIAQHKGQGGYRTLYIFLELESGFLCVCGRRRRRRARHVEVRVGDKIRGKDSMAGKEDGSAWRAKLSVWSLLR
jgi:hypothetical protein